MKATSQKTWQTKFHLFLLVSGAAALVWSGIKPHDYVTWVEEVLPAMLGRELLIRTSPLRRGKWMFFICTCMALAISAMYELIEWFAAVTSEAEDFVGSQGDIWDAQSDMLLAMLGAMIAQIIFARLQDRQMDRIQLRKHA